MKRTLAFVVATFAASSASAQARLPADTAEYTPPSSCTAIGTPQLLNTQCDGEISNDLECTTRLTADLTDEPGVETLVECGDRRDGESWGAFAIFSGTQLRWAFVRNTEWSVGFEVVDLLDREEASPRYELVLHLGSEDGSEDFVFGAYGRGMRRIFRGLRGGGEGGDPTRVIRYVLEPGNGHIEIALHERPRARPEIWRFDSATSVFTRAPR